MNDEISPYTFDLFLDHLQNIGRELTGTTINSLGGWEYFILFLLNNYSKEGDISSSLKVLSKFLLKRTNYQRHLLLPKQLSNKALIGKLLCQKGNNYVLKNMINSDSIIRVCVHSSKTMLNRIYEEGLIFLDLANNLNIHKSKICRLVDCGNTDFYSYQLIEPNYMTRSYSHVNKAFGSDESMYYINEYYLFKLVFDITYAIYFEIGKYYSDFMNGLYIKTDGSDYIFADFSKARITSYPDGSSGVKDLAWFLAIVTKYIINQPYLTSSNVITKYTNECRLNHNTITRLLDDLGEHLKLLKYLDSCNVFSTIKHDLNNIKTSALLCTAKICCWSRLTPLTVNDTITIVDLSKEYQYIFNSKLVRSKFLPNIKKYLPRLTELKILSTPIYFDHFCQSVFLDTCANPRNTCVFHKLGYSAVDFEVILWHLCYHCVSDFDFSLNNIYPTEIYTLNEVFIPPLPIDEVEASQSLFNVNLSNNPKILPYLSVFLSSNSIRELNLSNCGLYSGSLDFSKIIHLEKIDLSRNYLSDLTCLKNNHKVRVLNVSNNLKLFSIALVDFFMSNYSVVNCDYTLIGVKHQKHFKKKLVGNLHSKDTIYISNQQDALYYVENAIQFNNIIHQLKTNKNKEVFLNCIGTHEWPNEILKDRYDLFIEYFCQYNIVWL